MIKSENFIELKQVTSVEVSGTQIEHGASDTQAVGGGDRTKESKEKRRMRVEDRSSSWHCECPQDCEFTGPLCAKLHISLCASWQYLECSPLHAGAIWNRDLQGQFSQAPSCQCYPTVKTRC